jgi:hypothetical protein
VNNENVFVPTQEDEGDLAIFLRYLTLRSKNDQFIRVHCLTNVDLLQFLACFQGETIKIPSGKVLEKTRLYCRIYWYVADRGFTLPAMNMASDQFGKKLNHLKRIVTKIHKELTDEDLVEKADGSMRKVKSK